MVVQANTRLKPALRTQAVGEELLQVFGTELHLCEGNLRGNEMDVRAALKGQYRAGLAMLREAVELCPDEVWVAGEHPRNFWRIAYHAVFYTHLYLQATPESLTPWPKAREHARLLWEDPPEDPPYSQEEILGYVDLVDAGVDAWVDALDLDSPESGFYWYPGVPKLDHQLMNIRHLQGHVGQLSELLMAQGIDTDWMTLG